MHLGQLIWRRIFITFTCAGAGVVCVGVAEVVGAVVVAATIVDVTGVTVVVVTVGATVC